MPGQARPLGLAMAQEEDGSLARGCPPGKPRPAIFSGDVTDHGLQIEQGVLVGFGTSEVGRQALMHLDQGQRPSSYLLEGWFECRVCGMVEGPHAFLFSDGSLSRCFSFLVECHISSSNARGFFSPEEVSVDQVTSATVV